MNELRKKDKTQELKKITVALNQFGRIQIYIKKKPSVLSQIIAKSYVCKNVDHITAKKKMLRVSKKVK